MGPDQATLRRVFSKELQNRAVGLLATQQLQIDRAGLPDGVFWRAYAALEAFNRCVYAPYAQRYELTVDATATSKVAAKAARLLFRLSSKHYGKMLADGARRHTERLKPLVDLSPAMDRAFFLYVVEQERVQILANEKVRLSDFKGASDVLRDVVKRHAAAGFHDCASNLGQKTEAEP
ncbi:MAG: hypothetical protein AAF662_12860 [Pseudomonadota bacterium]